MPPASSSAPSSRVKSPEEATPWGTSAWRMDVTTEKKMTNRHTEKKDFPACRTLWGSASRRGRGAGSGQSRKAGRAWGRKRIPRSTAESR